MIGAFISGLAIASIFYWPPNYRKVKWKLGILRLLVVVACIGGIGFLYRSAAIPDMFLNTIIVSSVTMFIMTPVQYALS